MQYPVWVHERERERERERASAYVCPLELSCGKIKLTENIQRSLGEMVDGEEMEDEFLA